MHQQVAHKCLEFFSCLVEDFTDRFGLFSNFFSLPYLIYWISLLRCYIDMYVQEEKIHNDMVSGMIFRIILSEKHS